MIRKISRGAAGDFRPRRQPWVCADACFIEPRSGERNVTLPLLSPLRGYCRLYPEPTAAPSAKFFAPLRGFPIPSLADFKRSTQNSELRTQ